MTTTDFNDVAYAVREALTISLGRMETQPIRRNAILGHHAVTIGTLCKHFMFVDGFDEKDFVSRCWPDSTVVVGP